MRKIGLALSGLAVCALVGVGPAVAATKKAPKKKTSTTKKLTVTLNGSNEAPTKGPAKGKGTAKLTLNSSTGKVCYTLSYSGIDTVTMSHIHKAAAGHAGPVVIPLFTSSAAAKKKGCVTASKQQVAAIIKKPSGYYVNIHTTKFPGGAIRGQL